MIVSSVETAVIVVFAVLCPTVSVGHELDATSTSTVVYEAVLNLTYWDRATGEWRSRDGARGPPVGIYAVEGRAEPEWGRVIHVRTADNRTDGCVSPVVSVPPPSERWIALVQKGNCGIQQKISNTAAAIANISAVVIYGHDLDSEPQLYRGRVEDIVLVFVSRQSGELIASLADNSSLKLMMQISLGRQKHLPYNHINKTSVLFVSISFIVLMVISLAWLIFYYIQRFRYTHTKDRLTKRLTNAAKKALSRIPQKAIRKCDIELDPEFDLCAICVENYKVSDVVRLLACRHVFHKSCVDPWLLEQRTCPICKMDILQVYGIQVSPTQDSTSVTRQDHHRMYLEASSFLSDDSNPRLHPVEMAPLCPRPHADDTTTVAEIVNEPNAGSLSDIADAVGEYPQRQQTTV